jgi:ferritin
MLIGATLTAALNEQVGSELGASNQYLMLATYFDRGGLPELAVFFYRQSDEERIHAMKMVHYVTDAGGKVEIPAITQPTGEVKSAEHAAQMALDWELQVTGQINNLMDIAIKESDHLAQSFLRWFVDEQLEEVTTMDELLSVIKRAGEDRLQFVEEYIVRRGDPHGEGE